MVRAKAGQQCWELPENKIPILLNFIDAQYCQVMETCVLFWKW